MGLELKTTRHFWGPKLLICAGKIFRKNHLYNFHLSHGHFHCEKFEKKIASRSRVVTASLFWDQNSQLARVGNFSEKIATFSRSTFCPP